MKKINIITSCAYLLCGAIIIKILPNFIPFKTKFSIEMFLAFCIAYLGKMGIKNSIIISVVFLVWLIGDNYFNLNWISTVKQSDLISQIGSAVLFMVPSVIAFVTRKIVHRSA